MVQNKLFENYIQTAPIGQATKGSKISWIKYNFSRFFPLNKDAQMLDIGPGTGDVLRLWKQEGYKNIFSIDISNSVTKFLNHRGLPCQTVEDSVGFLKSKKEMYDCIVLSDVLEHIPRDEVISFVRAMYNSLHKGGILIIKVPNGQSPHFAVTLYGDITHVQAFTETSFKQMFSIIGCKRFTLISERQPIPNVGIIKYYIARYVLGPIYRKIVHLVRASSFHANPSILTQSIIAIIKK